LAGDISLISLTIVSALCSRDSAWLKLEIRFDSGQHRLIKDILLD